MDAAVVTALIVGSVTLVLGLVWYALRLIARVTRPDDTRTICGVSRLGTICKLSYLLGHPMPLLEAARFSFFPAEDDVSLQDPRAGGITSIEDIRGSQSSDTLVVAFSGGATNKIGLARLEFRRMLSQAGSATRQADQLYVLDQTGMSFYEHQIDSFQKHLAACLRPYQKVVFLGNCMGATAALRFSTLLQHAHDTVLAFNPEVNPPSDTRLPFRVAACLSPSTTSRLRRVLNDALMGTPAKIRVHASMWPPEHAQSMLLSLPDKGVVDKAGINAQLSTTNDDVRAMDVDYHDYAAAGGEAVEPPQPRVLRILHKGCVQHGMLAKRLKPNGSLRKILDDAVGGRTLEPAVQLNFQKQKGDQ